MKGQSAIEYLATYGWMLLAVAAVSSIAYSNIQEPCSESAETFYSDALEMRETGLAESGNLSIALENVRYQDIQLNNVTVEINDQKKSKDLALTIKPSEKKLISLKGFKSVENCNKINVNIGYDRGSLKNQQSNGIIESSIGFNN